MSEAQKTFNFYINGATKGPLTESEANALIASGEITPETLCAPEGASTWEAASNHLTFNGVPPKPAASASTAASARNYASINEDDRQSGPELPQHIRKKLIKLGLASATTIDSFNELQAIAAINAYETEKRKAKNARILGGIGGLVGGALFGAIICMTPVGPKIGAHIGSKIASESKQYAKARETIAADLSKLENARRILDEAKLREPEGARPGRYLRDRVRMPASQRDLLQVKINFAQLDPALRQKPRLVYFNRLDSSVKRKMEEQLNIALKYKNPEKLTEKLDETELVASWNLFRSEESRAIAEFVKANKLATVEITDPSVGEWRIEGRNSQYVALAVDMTVGNAAPLTVYLPYSGAQQVSLNRDEMFNVERYVVLEKAKIGDKSYGINATFLGRRYFLEKKTPVLYYLQMRQELFPDSAPIWVRASEEFFNKTQTGTLIPTKDLVEFSLYDRPTEHGIDGKLQFKS